LRYDRMSGLDSEQLGELVCRIEEQLGGPWDKGIGRPKSLTLREAVIVTCGYMRQNITQEVWAEIFDTSQPVVSGIIGKFTPLVEVATEEDRPTAEEAKEAAAREQTVLVDGLPDVAPGQVRVDQGHAGPRIHLHRGLLQGLRGPRGTRCIRPSARRDCNCVSAVSGRPSAGQWRPGRW